MRDDPATILIVDDSAVIRRLTSVLLEAEGYRTLQAPDGSSARALFLEHAEALDLVILDVHLPDTDGFELIGQLRRLPGGADVPMIFLTGSDRGKTHERALDLGADDFLLKPIQATEMRLRVRSLVRIKRLDEERRRHLETIRALDSAKEELTALLVHDLKHPLSAILGFATIIAEDAGSSAAPMAERIVENARQLHRMILDLLDIRRSEEGELRATRQHVDLGTLVLRVVAGAEGRARRASRSLQVSVPPAAVPAHIDPDLVERLLANLVDNALRYTPRGSTVHLAIDSSAPLRVSVSDEGPGVPPDQRERIFQKYTQLDVNLRASGEHARASRGLGLTFCLAAARAHGGSIHVEDREPTGARFVVTLGPEAEASGEPQNT